MFTKEEKTIPVKVKFSFSFKSNIFCREFEIIIIKRFHNRIRILKCKRFHAEIKKKIPVGDGWSKKILFFDLFRFVLVPLFTITTKPENDLACFINDF